MALQEAQRCERSEDHEDFQSYGLALTESYNPWEVVSGQRRHEEVSRIQPLLLDSACQLGFHGGAKEQRVTRSDSCSGIFKEVN